MNERKFNFTKINLERVSLPPPGKRAYYYDAKVAGLGISVTDKGTRTFILYRKVQGKPERIVLGRFPDISIENARERAYQAKAAIAQGKNPNREKNKLKAELTIKGLFHQYLEEHAKKHKRSWKSDVNQYRLYLSSWDNRHISSIHRSDVETLHTKVGQQHGFYAANRMLSLLGVMFNKAIDWGWGGDNPVKGVKKYKEQSRERFLQGDELARFFKAIGEEHNEVLADFFMVALLTGARRNNVMQMRWQDIDFPQSIWRIPQTKNGSPQTVVLSEQANEVLAKRLLTTGRDIPWVFPSAKSKSGHLEEPKSAWKRILERANLQDLRLHDLRRTLGSWQAATGANSYVIGKTLGHKTQQATAIYARMNLDPVRESLEHATKAMLINKV